MQVIDSSEVLQPQFLRSGTVQLAVATSGFCNARCEFCIWPYMSPDSSVMSIAHFNRLLDRFDRFSFSELAFDVINEPFIDRTICEKLRISAARQVPIGSLFFSSNWLLPNSKQIADFVGAIFECDACPTIKSISLNATISGIDETTYDRSQAGSTLSGTIAGYRHLDFDKAVANVCAVLKGLATLGLAKPLSFRIKAYSGEIDHQSLTSFWRETFARHAVPTRFVQQHVQLESNRDRITFARFEGAPLRFAAAEPRICASGFLTEKLVVGVHGQLGLCCQDGLRDVVIGNIFEESLDQIVASAPYQQHLRVVTGRECPSALHPCLRCEFYTIDGSHPYFPTRPLSA